MEGRPGVWEEACGMACLRRKPNRKSILEGESLRLAVCGPGLEAEEKQGEGVLLREWYELYAKAGGKGHLLVAEEKHGIVARLEAVWPL